MTPSQIKTLKNIIASLTALLPKEALGRADTSSDLIDTDKDPYCPSYLTVESHKKGGLVDPKKIGLYLSKGQKVGWLNGTALQKELENKPTLNACVLDYLLAHTDEIPESWKQYENGNTRYIYFWGTIYRSSDGDLCVRCLCWDGGRWCWSDGWLGSGFGGQSPAAVLASP